MINLFGWMSSKINDVHNMMRIQALLMAAAAAAVAALNDVDIPRVNTPSPGEW